MYAIAAARSALHPVLRRAALLFLVVLSISRWDCAAAQQFALFVNGDPITTIDIEQRAKLMTLLTHKTVSRKETIDDLIEEKLKIQVGRRYRLEISDEDVDSAYTDMAKRMRLTPPQLTAALGQQGVDSYTLKDHLRADLVWQQIVRGKFQSSMQINEKSIIDAMQARQKGDEKEVVGTEYALRPILFVVPRGAGQAAIDGRKREAEALRARFDDCDAGLPFARALRDVAVREQIVKTSADLQPALKEILDKTEVGHLTEPEVTQQGVEVFALCSKKQTKIESEAKRQVQQELFTEQFTKHAKQLMKTLRAQAMIETKELPNDKPTGPRANAR